MTITLILVLMTAWVGITADIGEAAVDEDVVLAMPFDTEEAVDISTLEHKGTIEGDVKLVEGKFRKALSFDGEGDKVLVESKGDALDIVDSNVSIVMWAKLANSGVKFDAFCVKNKGGGSKRFYGRESQYWKWLAAALHTLLLRASQLDLTLAFEAAGPYGRFVHNVSRVKHLLNCEGLEALRVVFDPSHYHLRGDSVVKAYEALSHRVVHVHTKDAKGDPEDFEFPPLGKGEIDFDGLLGALVADGYDGYISVEYEGFAWGYESDCRKVLADSKSFIERILASKQNC